MTLLLSDTLIVLVTYSVITVVSFYRGAAMQARYCDEHTHVHPSVCLSVRLSVKRATAKHTHGIAVEILSVCQTRVL